MRTVVSIVASAPPATTAAIGTADRSPSAINGVTTIPPANMQAPRTADAEPATRARCNPQHGGVRRHQTGR
jgi:hypothetical protein